MASQDGGEIKSAFEKAMERVKDLEAPSDEKRLEWKGVPEGNRLAAAFLRGEGDIGAAVAKEGDEVKSFVLRGIVDVLSVNIQLPKHEVARKATLKALDGLRAVFGEQKVDDLAGRVNYVCEQYTTHGEQQRQQVFEQLKQQFAARVQDAMRRQGVAGQPPANIEATPEFQSEWMRVRIRLDEQYEGHLQGFREEIKALA